MSLNELYIKDTDSLSAVVKQLWVNKARILQRAQARHKPLCIVGRWGEQRRMIYEAFLTKYQFKLPYNQNAPHRSTKLNIRTDKGNHHVHDPLIEFSGKVGESP